MLKLRTLSIAAVGIAALLPAFAGEGRKPIARAGTTLSAPGSYFVSRNLSAPAGSILTVAASNVEIDLNGMVLDATGSASPAIASNGVAGITIRNGTILGGSRAIEILNGARVVIEGVQIETTGLGILLSDTTEFALRRNVLRDASTGIFVGGSGSPTTTGTVEHNLIEDCNQAIRLENMNGCAVLNNRVRNAPSNGVQLFFSANCLVDSNTLEQANLRFNNGGGTTISNNVISHALPGNIGIDIGEDDNLVLNNIVTHGGSIGILAGGNRNHLQGNVSNSNSNWGFAFIGSDNVYRGNTAKNNGGVAGSPPACVSPCSPDLCLYTTGTGNTSQGDNNLPGPPGFPGCI